MDFQKKKLESPSLYVKFNYYQDEDHHTGQHFFRLIFIPPQKKCFMKLY